jgi:hypothetical protein
VITDTALSIQDTLPDWNDVQGAVGLVIFCCLYLGFSILAEGVLHWFAAPAGLRTGLMRSGRRKSKGAKVPREWLPGKLSKAPIK